MAVAGFAYDFTGISGRVIAVWYRNSNLSAEVGRKVLDLPNGQGSFNVEGLQKALYVFKFYQSSDGTTLETLLRQITYNANTQKIVSETFEYVVGRGETGDPTPDTNILADSRLEGALKSELSVKRRGVGELIKVEFDLHTGGGVELTNGNLFGDGEIFHITRQYAVTEPEENTGGSEAVDVVEIISNTTFEAAKHLNKIISLEGGSETVVFTMPAFSSIPDGGIKFIHNSSTARYLKIQFASGNYVFFYNKNRNRIHLGKGHLIEIVIKEGKCYVVSSARDSGYDKVGETEMSNYKDKPNAILCDGSHVEYNIADFERLFDELPSEMKVLVDKWDNDTVKVIVGNKTFNYYYQRRKFGVNEATGKFKFPDLRDTYFKTLAHFDGTTDPTLISQGAGGFGPMQLIEHGHTIKGTDGDQGPSETVVDWGNDSYTVKTKLSPIGLTGSSRQEVDHTAKYGIVYI